MTNSLNNFQSNAFDFVKYPKVFLLLLLGMHILIKPIIGEIVLGAVGAAALKVATSPSGKAARWAATGYLLNTSVGKKFVALGFNKMRQVASNRFFPAQIGTRDCGIILASSNALKRYGQSSVQLFRGIPKSLAAFKAYVVAMTFRNPFSMVTEFHAETNLRAFGPWAPIARSPFIGTKNGFAQPLTYHKAQAGLTESFTASNRYSVHQASGLFPRINHYHGDQGQSGFWKGFSIGSFGSWATAWYLGNRKAEQKAVVAASQYVKT